MSHHGVLKSHPHHHGRTKSGYNSTSIDQGLKQSTRGGSQPSTCTDHNGSLEARAIVDYQDEYQLQLWAYETSSEAMTFAERLEKAKWEVARLEKL